MSSQIIQTITQHTQSSVTNPSGVFTRRLDLDWLRIIAFGLLIFYHIGVFFNSGDWHANSLHSATELEPVMSLFSPWRLPLLFFISGVAVRYLSDKMGSLKFAGDRFVRLFPVILFGMYVIVAPQSYSEMVGTGEVTTGYWDFYQRYAGEWGGPWSVHTPTWNHLWYVVYLMVYCILLAPLFPVLRALANSRVMTGFGNLMERKFIGPVLLISLLALPFLLIRFTLTIDFETTHDLTNDWANHANSLTILFIRLFLRQE